MKMPVGLHSFLVALGGPRGESVSSPFTVSQGPPHSMAVASASVLSTQRLHV